MSGSKNRIKFDSRTINVEDVEIESDLEKVEESVTVSVN